MWAALGDYVAGAPEDLEEEEIEAEEEPAEGTDEKKKSGEEGPALNFWSMASALRDSVKQRTAELAASIKETDWKQELGAFQQGLKEDSDELQQKTKEAVEHLPAVVEQLKKEHAGAVLSAKAKEAQAQLAQAGKSLGSFGHKLVLGTSQLFDQVKEAIQSEMAFDEGGPAGRRVPSRRQLAAGAGAAKYSRFEADVSAMQRDSSTYCDEPEDEEDYAAWLAGFDLAARRPDIDALIASNTFMAELQARIVPLIVEYDAFWTRYFYRLHKLQQKHEQFVQLTQRANQQEEEEVGWGSDEEGEAGSARALSPAREGGGKALSPKGAAAPAQQAAPAEAVAAAEPAEAPRAEQEAALLAAPAGAAAPHEPAPTAAAAGPAPATGSPAMSDGSTGTTSEASQISGGTPERWTVVSSPRGAKEAGQQQQEEQQRQEQGAALVAGEGTGPAAAAAAQPAAAEKPVAKEAPVAAKTGAAEGSASKEAAPAATAAVAAAAAAAGAAAPPTAAAAEPTAAATTAGAGEEDLSDFDVDDDDGAAAGAGGEEDLDENWGDDWE